MKQLIQKGSICSALVLICSCTVAPTPRTAPAGDFTAMDAFQRQWKAADSAYVSQNQPTVEAPAPEDTTAAPQKEEESFVSQNQPTVEAPAPEDTTAAPQEEEESIVSQNQPTAEAPAPEDTTAAPQEEEESIVSQNQPDVPALLSTRRKIRAEEAAQEQAEVTPTNAQLEAARQMLDTQSVQEQSPAPEEVQEESTPLPGSGRPVLRAYMRPEEAASTRDAEAPRPNSVEMRGLRSPEMPDTLPMNIDGKLLHHH